MIAIDRCMALMINLGKLRGLGILEKQRHTVIKRGVIFLEGQDIVGFLIGDRRGVASPVEILCDFTRSDEIEDPLAIRALDESQDLVDLMTYVELVDVPPLMVPPNSVTGRSRTSVLARAATLFDSPHRPRPAAARA